MLSERFVRDDDKIHHIREFDVQPALDRVRLMRDAGKARQGENMFIGSVPLAMVTQWLTEAGLTWDDSDAVQDVIRRKLLDGEFSKLRVHEGTF